MGKLCILSYCEEKTIRPGLHVCDNHSSSEIFSSIRTRERNMLLFLVLVLILISLVLWSSQVSPGDLRLKKTLSNKAENVKNNH